MKRIRIPGHRKGTTVPLASIVYMQGSGNYTIIYYKTEKIELASQTLGDFEKNLPEFIRVSKGLLVNPEYIASVNRGVGYYADVRLKNGTILQVSRRRWLGVKERFIAARQENKQIEVVLNS